MKRNIIQLHGDLYGLYVSGMRGPYGTTLQAKGTLEFVTGLNVEYGGVRDNEGRALTTEQRGL